MTRRPLAVVVDGHKDAVQEGLAEADILIRAPAEGGIPRYLALYFRAVLPPFVGPVRSARLYFVQWAERYNPIFAHCGGSQEALQYLKIAKVKDVDMRFVDKDKTIGEKFFELRDNRPHHVFLDTSKVEREEIDHKYITYIPGDKKQRLAIVV